jgi:hypothetical protein
MFLPLAHTKPDVFVVGKNFVLSCYRVSKLLPLDERFNMVQQLRRAALSVQLNMQKEVPGNLQLKVGVFMKCQEAR